MQSSELKTLSLRQHDKENVKFLLQSPHQWAKQPQSGMRDYYCVTTLLADNILLFCAFLNILFCGQFASEHQVGIECQGLKLTFTRINVNGSEIVDAVTQA